MQRTESIVEVDGVEKGRYGLGLDLHTLGSRRTFGHSGGFPGFVTRTFVDPQDGLIVSVLTNQSGGPAHEIAVGVLGLVDLAVKVTSTVPGRTAVPTVPDDLDARSFAVSLATGFGHLDIVEMAGRLVLVHPGVPDPAADPAFLEVIDADTLRILPSAGYATAGETVRYQRDPAGVITAVTVGGMRSWPVEAFRSRRRKQMARRPGDTTAAAPNCGPDPTAAVVP